MFAIAAAVAFSLLIDPPKKTVVPLGPALRVDRANGFALIDAEVIQREVPLELLLSPRNLREHETILVSDVKPQDIHVALLLAGAIPGRPLQVDPFVPPTGQRIKVWVEIESEKGRKLVDGREWIRNQRTNQPLKADFVFAGSAFVRPPSSDRTVYLANEGYIICVANFPHSIVDVGVRSSKEAAELDYVAWKERIPEKGTKVKVILEPIVD